MNKVKQTFNKISQKIKGKGNKATYFALALMAVALVPNLAHAGINEGLSGASTQITTAYALVSKLCLAIGAIVGLVGGIRVYVKWNNGDHEIQKEIIGWGGACVFLLLTGTVLTAFFT